ncbi:hypothetical protein J4226_00885 [Candidatus Pacearchaeota archaeon]|nr:hypothetical protein [Candidatus Pacearchaeota archaeon]
MSGIYDSDVSFRKMGEEFYLDWKKDTLQVWELYKSSFVVAAMREGIRIGSIFPAVYVVRICDNFYRLAAGEANSKNIYDGGHHRAVAHYLEKKSLLCLLSDRIGANPNDYRDIGLVELGDYNLPDKLEDSLSKLPVDLAEKFRREKFRRYDN